MSVIYYSYIDGGHNMELKSLLQDAVSYIEEHILDDISYEDVAKKVYMSNYNFHRIFSMVTGMTANTYIRKRRLTLAGQELQTTDISVINAAYK
jgi:AraC family transcriptional regulator